MSFYTQQCTVDEFTDKGYQRMQVIVLHQCGENKKMLASQLRKLADAIEKQKTKA